MNIAYARTPLAKSIFLAGPTPRDPSVPSWRPQALTYLDDIFTGTVFVPEDGDQSWAFDYDDQIEWELEALHAATVIVFWVPRQMVDMPALTTNVEFGLFAARRNIVLGSPPNSQKNKYLAGIATMYNIPVYPTLESTLYAAVALTNRPFNTSSKD